MNDKKHIPDGVSIEKVGKGSGEIGAELMTEAAMNRLATPKYRCPVCGVIEEEYTVLFEKATGGWDGPYCVQCLTAYMVEGKHGIPVLQPIKSGKQPHKAGEEA